MKINNNYTYIQTVSELPKVVSQKKESDYKMNNEDRITLSDSSINIEVCVKRCKDIEQDSRAAVERIKSEIQQGTYKVSPEKIADGIFKYIR